MTEHQVPDSGWLVALTNALEKAGAGDTVVVGTETMRELGYRAAGRMGKDVTITVRPDDAAEVAS